MSGTGKNISRLDAAANVAAIAAAICAIVVAAAVFVRGNPGQSGRGGDVPLEADTLVLPRETWSAIHDGGRRLGGPSPVLTVVEFGDFECPACAGFHRAWSNFAKVHPGEVALVYRHWPLPYHRFALAAARAAECAARQERFAEMHGLLYERQDSIGLLPFAEFAGRAGVPDLSSFESCIVNPDVDQTINADRELALAVGGRGTPTLVVNGVRIAHVPDSAMLEELYDRAAKLRRQTSQLPTRLQRARSLARR